MSLTLDLEPHELVAVIDGLRSEISKRAYWMISPSHPVRGWELEDEITILDPMVQAYTKAMMAARTITDDLDERFLDEFLLIPEVWDLLDKIARAQDWDDVPIHRHRPQACTLCDALVTVG